MFGYPILHKNKSIFNLLSLVIFVEYHTIVVLSNLNVVQNNFDKIRNHFKIKHDHGITFVK